MLFSHHYLNFIFNTNKNYFMQDNLKNFRKPFIEVEETKYIWDKKVSAKTQLIKYESLLSIPIILFSV